MIREAFEASLGGSIPNLSHLVFGYAEGTRLVGAPKFDAAEDVLTRYFKDEGKTRLTYEHGTDWDMFPGLLPYGYVPPLATYTTLFVAFRGRHDPSSHRPTHSWHATKEMWSVTPNFPSNSLPA